MKASRVVVSLMLGLVGLLLILYGLLALTFREGEGDSYVMLGGHHVDARLVGGISLSLGVSALVGAGRFLRSRRSLE